MRIKFSAKTKGLLLIGVHTLSVFTLSACGGKNIQQADEVKNVRVAAAAIASIETGVDYSSKLKAFEEVAVSAKIPGKVESVKVDVGQTVKAGDILFTLDKKDVEAQHEQAQAALNSANANYRRTGDSALSQQITQAESAVRQAQVQYDSAKDLFEKTQILYQSGAVSKQQTDDVENRYKSAKIQLDTAKENLTLLKDRSGPQSISVASAEVDRAKAAVKQSALQLDNTTIASPVSGVVSARNVDEGEIAAGGVPAFTVMDTKSMIAEINVPDKMVWKIRKNQVVPVKINALDGKMFEGRVDTVSPGADARTQLYSIRIIIDNPKGILLPGMFARVTLPVEKKENAVIVPNEAIVMENSIPYVYTVTEGVIRKKEVVPGLANEKNTEIAKGLEAGENVVTEGQNFINEGEKVNIVK